MSEHTVEKAAPVLREEWAVRHAQGVYVGRSYGSGLSERQAREWAAENIARDAKRRVDARGRTALLRRFVTEWEDVPDSVLPPGGSDV